MDDLGEARVRVDARIVHGAPDGGFLPGAGGTEWFKDHACGPEMLVVPAGAFTMGAVGAEAGTPTREMTIAEPFAVGRNAVTFAEWDAAQDHPDWRQRSGIAPRRPYDEGWGRDRHPVIDVCWEDATAYCRWLAHVTGKPYRLLSEAEWEYCCRAGTTTDYCFGDTITESQALFSQDEREAAGGTVEVASFPANAWGLHDMHGNVWEWCADAWQEDVVSAPGDGSVRPGGDPCIRVVRGGSWLHGPQYLRSGNRGGNHPATRSRSIGFRVARSLAADRLD